MSLGVPGRSGARPAQVVERGGCASHGGRVVEVSSASGGGEKTKKWWGRQYTSICKEKTAIKVWLGPLVEKNPLQCHESYLFCHLLQNHTQKPYSERTGRHIWLVGRFVQNRTWCHPAQRDDPAHGVTDTNTLEATKQLLDPATRVQARRPSHRQNWHQQVDKWSGTCP